LSLAKKPPDNAPQIAARVHEPGFMSGRAGREGLAVQDRLQAEREIWQAESLK
jgi:hypothetical protein